MHTNDSKPRDLELAAPLDLPVNKQLKWDQTFLTLSMETFQHRYNKTCSYSRFFTKCSYDALSLSEYLLKEYQAKMNLHLKNGIFKNILQNTQCTW